MKGVTIISDIFLLIMSLALTILMVGFIYAMIFIHGVEAQLGVASPRSVEYEVLFNPVEYDTTLLAYLEYKYEGIPMKKVLNAVAIQRKRIIWIDGKSVNAKIVSEDYFKDLITRPYLLKIREPEIHIAKSGVLPAAPATIQKISTKLFLLNGESVDLELYVG